MADGLVAGVDGCPAGWIAVLWDGGEHISPHLCRCFGDVLALPAAIIAVDMPIGLPEQSGRAPERPARLRLGKRRSSVFAVPSQAAVMCEDYRISCTTNLLHSDPPRKVSKQCFHLFAKMREIDAVMTPALQSRVFESHPELAFWAMNGERPLGLAKKAKGPPSGLDFRRALLRKSGFPIDALANPYRKHQAGENDLIDACACAIVAWRISRGRSICFPADSPRNARGLRMEINA